MWWTNLNIQFCVNRSERDGVKRVEMLFGRIQRFAAIFVVYLILPLSQCNPITNEETDISRQCIKFDFESVFNRTFDKKIVAVYNSALCKRCVPKLLAFKALQLRFEIADFNDIQFIVLTAEQSNTKQFAELQSRAGDILVISLHDIENEFFVAGSVNIFDKCGRLTYDILQPWSETRYQLVKAAILSTWYDAPCGKCIEINNETDFSDLLLFDKDVTAATTLSYPISTTDILQVETNTEYDDIDDFYNLQVQSNDSEVQINMRVVIPVEHVHRVENGTYVKYNFIVFESKDSVNLSEPHQHLNSDQSELLFAQEKPNEIRTNNSSTRLPEYLYGIDGQRFKVSLSKPGANKTETNQTDTTLQNYEYLEINAIHNISVATPSFSIKPQQDIENSVTPSVLEKLRKWLSYRLLSPFYNL